VSNFSTSLYPVKVEMCTINNNNILFKTEPIIIMVIVTIITTIITIAP